MRWILFALLAGLPCVAACAGAGDAPERRAAPGAGDPSEGEVPLPASAGWHASLVLDNEPTGVWTLKVMKVFPYYACPEIVGLDDKGRCLVMRSYSGKWTPFVTIEDGTWLGGLTQGDVDPRIPGPEIYAGARSGNVYQVVAHREGPLDNRRVVWIAGHEIHTLVAAELDTARPGDELIAFTRPGGLWRLAPRSDGLDGFEAELLETNEARVRDALVLRGEGPGNSDAIVTASRTGELAILTFEAGRPRWEIVHQRAMGMGRLARRPGDGPLVLYSTDDDGLVWRHGRSGAGGWEHELIYAGPQGPRGIAAGRFDADPARETVAVFGYSQDVELLTRPVEGGGPWRVETIFQDRDKGHWLAVGELDGRNSTDELVAAGYGNRIVLLARPPGYGIGDDTARAQR